jgi:hypothetical protein
VKAVDGEEINEDARASYLVGADGTKGGFWPYHFRIAHLRYPAGVVRKLLGLSFLGETRAGDGHWIFSDVVLKNAPFDKKVDRSSP